MLSTNIEEVVTSVVAKIVETRKEKGLSLENIASELGLSTSAYNKIERLETKLTLERLLQIQRILQAPLTNFLEISDDKVYNQTNNDHATGFQGIENMYQESKEITEKLIRKLEELLESKDEVIKELKLRLND